MTNSDKVTEDIMLLELYDTTSKVLGIQWSPKKDVFTFLLNLEERAADTKRKLLSQASKIFDPLGWLSPVTVLIKILFQSLWLLKYDWDELLPTSVSDKWSEIKHTLPQLQRVSIPRVVVKSDWTIELHGFSDASKSAFSAVVYVRCVTSNSPTFVRLLCSKTKVAPLKEISIPRLELSGAVLLTRLLKRVVQALKNTNLTIFVWTDSTTILYWISDVPRRWSTFVANRVAEIIETFPRKHWKYVPSKQNPADLASRGLMIPELLNSELWWNGPSWLSGPVEEWPADPTTSDSVCSEQALHERRKTCIFTTLQTKTTSVLDDLLVVISSFSKIVRVIAYCRRFVHNVKCKNKDNRRIDFLSTSEYFSALNACLKWVQESAYQAELSALHSGKPVAINSKLSNLYPFLDNAAIIRVGGRIKNSSHDFYTTHPIVLPQSHPFVILMVRDMHIRYLHPGTSLLISILRQRYWIVGVRNLVRKINHTCPTCFRFRITPNNQLMGILPDARVNQSRPFSHVGIDFAGPIMISSRTGRGSKMTKAYIALFVCLAVKALHLELVSSLSSETFVAALRRFAARRGVPSNIYCDNGTNFVGGKRHLTEMHQLATKCYSDSIISPYLLQNNIQWQFSPPSAPHFGGLWEAGVKSIKWHLRRVIGDTKLGQEEMTTLLCQIEAVLNSRPLIATSVDANDACYLTPSHFLIGEAITTIPEPSSDVENLKLLDRWKLVQSMMQGFWKKWRQDYLTSLQVRQKWKREKESLKPDDVVVIHDENLPPTKWLLGRVVETHPGRDNLIRVVTIKTSKGLLKRAIHKVTKLPTS